MAKVVCKGTVFQVDIASTLTAVAQLTSIEGPEAEVMDADITTLDTSGAGKEYGVTGYVEPGEVEYEGFLDPALAGHQDLTDNITTPAVRDHKLIFADSGTTEWAFSALTKKLGPTIDMDDFLKFSASSKLSGLVTYPT